MNPPNPHCTKGGLSSRRNASYKESRAANRCAVNKHLGGDRPTGQRMNHLSKWQMEGGETQPVKKVCLQGPLNINISPRADSAHPALLGWAQLWLLSALVILTCGVGSSLTRVGWWQSPLLALSLCLGTRQENRQEQGGVRSKLVMNEKLTML